MTATLSARRPAISGSVITALGILAIAANLRSPIVGASPLISEIKAAENLSGTMAGLITALATLCFGLASFVAPKLGVRIGMERSLFIALGVLILGMVIRSIPPTWMLFLGTLLAGLGIGIANVLVPALIKRDFAHKAGLMTGLYSMALTIGAALAAGLVVPIANAADLSWRPALLVWVIPVVIALILWLPQLGKKHVPAVVGGPQQSFIKDPIAWAVTIFMALQSLIFYSMTAWLPLYLNTVGMSESTAGLLLALSNGTALIATFIVPIVSGRSHHQIHVVTALITMLAGSMLGIILLPHASIVWVIFFGLATGGSLSLSLMFFVLRTTSTEQTSQLSGMAQGFGYLIAAFGPIGVGYIHDASHSWIVAFLVLTACVIPQGISGYIAAQDKKVAGSTPNVKVTP